MDNNGNTNQVKEIETEYKPSEEKNISSQNLKLDLKNIEENEKSYKNEDDDSLSYTTLYRSSQGSFNKNSKDLEFSIKLRLSSTISTSQSDINYQESNGFSSEKNYFSQKSIKRIQPINLFGNEINNLVVNYYQDSEEYLKNLYPNKNDYLKTKNYIEKKIYYKDYDDENDYIKNKTIDFSEENENKNIVSENNNINTNNNSFISLNKEILNNNEENPLNNLNKNNNKNNNEKNNNINITNINNNCFINQIYINPNNTYNNLNPSKYDVSMYCLGYYSVDCKSKTKFNSYFYFLFFSIFRSTNSSFYP
jgi:hypothetical protein